MGSERNVNIKNLATLGKDSQYPLVITDVD